MSQRSGRSGHTSIRISADDRLRLDRLVEVDGRTTSDLVRAGIRTYCEVVAAELPAPTYADHRLSVVLDEPTLAALVNLANVRGTSISTEARNAIDCLVGLSASLEAAP